MKKPLLEGHAALVLTGPSYHSEYVFASWVSDEVSDEVSDKEKHNIKQMITDGLQPSFHLLLIIQFHHPISLIILSSLHGHFAFQILRGYKW